MSFSNVFCVLQALLETYMAVFSQMRLQEENERCLIYLDANTRKPLVATAERQLLVRHVTAILDKVAVLDTITNRNNFLSSCLCKNSLVILNYFAGFHDTYGWQAYRRPSEDVYALFQG